MSKKAPNSACFFCDDPVNTNLHTLFFCAAWERDRDLLFNSLGCCNILREAILESRKKWSAFLAFCPDVMLQKEEIDGQKQRFTVLELRIADLEHQGTMRKAGQTDEQEILEDHSSLSAREMDYLVSPLRSSSVSLYYYFLFFLLFFHSYSLFGLLFSAEVLFDPTSLCLRLPNGVAARLPFSTLS